MRLLWRDLRGGDFSLLIVRVWGDFAVVVFSGRLRCRQLDIYKPSLPSKGQPIATPLEGVMEGDFSAALGPIVHVWGDFAVVVFSGRLRCRQLDIYKPSLPSKGQPIATPLEGVMEGDLMH